MFEGQERRRRVRRHAHRSNRFVERQPGDKHQHIASDALPSGGRGAEVRRQPKAGPRERLAESGTQIVALVAEHQRGRRQAHHRRNQPKPARRPRQDGHTNHSRGKAHINRVRQPAVDAPIDVFGRREGIHRQPAAMDPQRPHAREHKERPADHQRKTPAPGRNRHPHHAGGSPHPEHQQRRQHDDKQRAIHNLLQGHRTTS